MSMAENTTASPSVDQAVPVVVPVIPPVAPTPKTSSWKWLIVVVLVAALGVGAYFFYAEQQKKSAVTGIQAPPAIGPTDSTKPGEGFGSQSSVPMATPTLTASDSVSDIEKDLSGTTIEAENTTAFDADLQSL